MTNILSILESIVIADMAQLQKSRSSQRNAMAFEGAVVREQGVTSALAAVKQRVVQNGSEAPSIISAFQPHFPGNPVGLVGQDFRGIPTYFERPVSRLSGRSRQPRC
jgi:hypothetical protein